MDNGIDDPEFFEKLFIQLEKDEKNGIYFKDFRKFFKIDWWVIIFMFKNID